MAAAVADYAPEHRAPQKVAKQGDTLTLTLKKNPDILADLGQRRLAAGSGPLLVGFAAETEDVVARARTPSASGSTSTSSSPTTSPARMPASKSTPTRSRSSARAAPTPSRCRASPASPSAILNHVERLLETTPAPPAVASDPVDRDQLIEHLRFAKELGVVRRQPRSRVARTRRGIGWRTLSDVQCPASAGPSGRG